MKDLLTTKSMDESWFLVSGQAYNPYNNTGMHLVSRRCRVTSSDAILPTLSKIEFAMFVRFYLLSCMFIYVYVNVCATLCVINDDDDIIGMILSRLT